MTRFAPGKALLLHGSAAAALIAAIACAPDAARAQGFQATPAVVQGTVTIDRTVAGIDRITIDGNDAVIDWRPDVDGLGASLIFLPAGNSGIFQSTPGATSFAVLNRVLDLGNGDPAVFEGLVQAFLLDGSGVQSGPGGFVAFYSPNGIIVGSTGRFEVPQLMLTTLDVDLGSFAAFASGTGPMLLTGGSAPVDIQPGAGFTGAPEDSFLIVAAPQIGMAGNAYFNGSIAYVAGTSVQLTHSSGLFDIIVNVGTAGPAITHVGSSGGPSSTGAGDEHVIYGVTAADASGAPVAMLFSGNLGFDPAASAGVVNGDIILSANYNVAGRNVDGDSNRQGADSFFDGRSFTPSGPADIVLTGVSASSNVLAIATHNTLLDAVGSTSSFAADLSLVGRQSAIVDAALGGQVAVGGDLFVSARNFGLNTQAIVGEDAVGGLALLRAGPGAQITVAGRTMVAASAIPGENIISGQIGSGTGGQAQILAEGGLIRLTGAVAVEAYARSDQTGSFAGSGVQTGGTAEVLADGGTLQLGGALNMTGDAAAAATTGADAIGGAVRIGTGALGGSVQVAGPVMATANALGGSGTNGGSGTGGSLSVSVANGGQVQLGGLVLQSHGIGGNPTAGTGGNGASGPITIDLAGSGSELSVVGPFGLSANAVGAFTNAGTGTGGSATGSDIAISLTDGATLDLAGAIPAVIRNLATGGDSQVVNGTGGAATSGAISANVQAGSTLSAGLLVIESTAFGGSEAGGTSGVTGGDATSGRVTVRVQEVSTLAAELQAASTAFGGFSASAAGGNALALDATFTASDAFVTLPGNPRFVSDAVGGNGITNGDASSGNATASFARTQAGGGSLTLGSIAQGDDATAGNAGLSASDTSAVGLNALTIASTAFGSAGGTAQAGTAALDVAQAAFIAPLIGISASTGGASTGIAGAALVRNSGGTITTDTLALAAIGDFAGPLARISADGGAIRINTLLDADVSGDILLDYANGGSIIGGASTANLVADFDILAGGTIALDGDNGATLAIAARNSQFTSADIAVATGTRFGGDSVLLNSTNIDERAVLGGVEGGGGDEVGGAGYSLSQAEADAISARSLRIVLPDLAGLAVDAVVADLALTGSNGGGLASVDILVDGTLNIAGALAINQAAPGDVLRIRATNQLQITLPTGSISITNGTAPAGTLLLDANRVVAANAALIAAIAADPASQAVADALLDDGGATSATSFITANRVDISAFDLVYTQNTGANGVYGGIRVGRGGLRIANGGDAQGLLRVIAFGLQDLGASQVTNNDWFNQVEFAADRPGTYSAGSTFNNCIIVSSDCPRVIDPNDPRVQIYNHVLLSTPLTFPEIAPEGATSDSEFGFDFPGLLDAPLTSEDELIRDPVTSGGDSAVHALTGAGAGSAADDSGGDR